MTLRRCAAGVFLVALGGCGGDAVSADGAPPDAFFVDAPPLPGPPVGQVSVLATRDLTGFSQDATIVAAEFGVGGLPSERYRRLTATMTQGACRLLTALPFACEPACPPE